MLIHLDLCGETERRLRKKAAQSGLALEAYLQQVIERAAQSTDLDTQKDSRHQIPQDEWERLLDELSEGLPPFLSLPADWSRTNLYEDHD
jgi:hypothetical protein